MYAKVTIRDYQITLKVILFKINTLFSIIIKNYFNTKENNFLCWLLVMF